MARFTNFALNHKADPSRVSHGFCSSVSRGLRLTDAPSKQVSHGERHIIPNPSQSKLHASFMLSLHGPKQIAWPFPASKHLGSTVLAWSWKRAGPLVHSRITSVHPNALFIPPASSFSTMRKRTSSPTYLNLLPSPNSAPST